MNIEPLSQFDPDSYYFNEVFPSVDGNFQSDYYTIANFNNKFSSKSENTALYIMNANIRSFTKNIECFVSNLNAMYRKLDVIVLTETWTDESTSEYGTISSYIGFHTDRTGRIEEVVSLCLLGRVWVAG